MYMKFSQYRKMAIVFHEFYTRRQLALRHSYRYHKSFIGYAGPDFTIKIVITSQKPNSFKVRVIPQAFSFIEPKPDFLAYPKSLKEANAIIAHKFPKAKFRMLSNSSPYIRNRIRQSIISRRFEYIDLFRNIRNINLKYKPV